MKATFAITWARAPCALPIHTALDWITISQDCKRVLQTATLHQVLFLWTSVFVTGDTLDPMEGSVFYVLLETFVLEETQHQFVLSILPW